MGRCCIPVSGSRSSPVSMGSLLTLLPLSRSLRSCFDLLLFIISFCVSPNSSLFFFLACLHHPTGTVSTLKQVKKDVLEIPKGVECGIALDDWDGFEPDDLIQSIEEIEVVRTL